ncbi:MAG: hypothetical protein M0T73_00595 [Deltaproteobacteria bacterium]|nr:hypothetical protein [Deltaproteobacteria bacterium]
MKFHCENPVLRNSSVSSACLRDLAILDRISKEDFERFRGIGIQKIFH